MTARCCCSDLSLPPRPHPLCAAYAELKPGKLSVQLSYSFAGGSAILSPPCNVTAPGSDCLPKLYAGDAVLITYNVNTTTPANSTSTVTLKACFGAESSLNRAWRKPGPLIADDKQCSTKVATKLPPTGQYLYGIAENTAPAVYRIIAIEICADGTACSMGASPGFYQVMHSNSRPGWLMAMTGVFAAIGPVVLAGFFITEHYIKKRK